MKFSFESHPVELFQMNLFWWRSSVVQIQKHSFFFYNPLEWSAIHGCMLSSMSGGSVCFFSFFCKCVTCRPVKCMTIKMCLFRIRCQVKSRVCIDMYKAKNVKTLEWAHLLDVCHFRLGNSTSFLWHFLNNNFRVIIMQIRPQHS